MSEAIHDTALSDAVLSHVPSAVTMVVLRGINKIGWCSEKATEHQVMHATKRLFTFCRNAKYSANN